MSDTHKMAEAMAAVIEEMKPILEAVQGQRKALEADGWSPTAAETYALELLLGLTRLVMGGGKR